MGLPRLIWEALGISSYDKPHVYPAWSVTDRWTVLQGIRIPTINIRRLIFTIGMRLMNSCYENILILQKPLVLYCLQALAEWTGFMARAINLPQMQFWGLIIVLGCKVMNDEIFNMYFHGTTFNICSRRWIYDVDTYLSVNAIHIRIGTICQTGVIGF